MGYRYVGCGGGRQWGRKEAGGGMPWGGLPTAKAKQDPPWGHAVRVRSSSLTSAAREKMHFGPNPTSRVTLDPPWVGVLGQRLSG